MRAIQEYSDASRCKAYPKPLTNFQFAGFDQFENEIFKTWLGLIGESEIEVAADQVQEIKLIASFKDQKAHKGVLETPAQFACRVNMWRFQSEADKAWAGSAHGCEFWQLVQHVPTHEEFKKAFLLTS